MDEFEHYTEVIQRYLGGDAEQSDLVALLEWLKSNPENIKFFNRISALWEHSSLGVNEEATIEFALSKLNRRIDEFENSNKLDIKPNNRQLIINFRRIAAALIILIAMAALIKYLIPDTAVKQSNPDYVYAYAPPSQKSQIILSDGTVVWLNSGTRIKYPINYGEKTRDVYLEGEAFFKVAKNPKKPFFVHASSLIVRAVGTSFNVKCYANDQTIETILVEGRVQIKNEIDESNVSNPIILNPNEKAVFNKKSQEIKIARFEELKKKVDEDRNEKLPVLIEQKTLQSEISWKEQQLVFENEAFEDLAKRLERWYNVNIRINDPRLLKNRYTGKFVNNEPLEQVLLVIEKTTPISYTIDKDNVVIDSK